MRGRLLILLLAAVGMATTSCAYWEKPHTLSELKADLDCIPYEKGATWNQIVSTLKDPDFAPLPEPGTGLSRNARIYRGTFIVFYVESQEVSEGGRIRFQEVVNHVDLCRKK